MLIARRNIIAFSFTCLTISWKASTDAKANPELIKPKRQEMSYCKGNHICVHGSDYPLRSPCRAQCATWNIMRVSASSEGTWLYILDIIHVILCGEDRFILCADDHLSTSFATLYAIGQIAKQFIWKASQFAGRGTPAITRCLCIAPLCLL